MRYILSISKNHWHSSAKKTLFKLYIIRRFKCLKHSSAFPLFTSRTVNKSFPDDYFLFFKSLYCQSPSSLCEGVDWQRNPPLTHAYSHWTYYSNSVAIRFSPGEITGNRLWASNGSLKLMRPNSQFLSFPQQIEGIMAYHYANYARPAVNWSDLHGKWNKYENIMPNTFHRLKWDKALNGTKEN